MNQVKIQHLSLGVMVEETFVNPVQFKLFLKLINGCLEIQKNLTYFNGTDLFTHVPYKILVECVITTKDVSELNLTLTSKIETIIK